MALLAGVVAAIASGPWIGALAGGCVGCVVPLTPLVIEPVNRLLMGGAESLAEAEAGELLTSWGRLHGFRTALGLTASSSPQPRLCRTDGVASAACPTASISLTPTRRTR